MFDPYGYDSYGYDDYYYDDYIGYDYGYGGDMGYGMGSPRGMGLGGRGRSMGAAVCDMLHLYLIKMFCWFGMEEWPHFYAVTISRCR